MAIQFMVSLKVDARTRGEILDLEELDAEGLARVDELILDMRDHVERIARARAARRAREPGA